MHQALRLFNIGHTAKRLTTLSDSKLSSYTSSETDAPPRERWALLLLPPLCPKPLLPPRALPSSRTEPLPLTPPACCWRRLREAPPLLPSSSISTEAVPDPGRTAAALPKLSMEGASSAIEDEWAAARRGWTPPYMEPEAEASNSSE